MMYHFLRLKMPPKNLLHHETMLAHIVMPVACRMIWRLYQDIAIFVNDTSPTPSPIPLHLRGVRDIWDLVLCEEG